MTGAAPILLVDRDEEARDALGGQLHLTGEFRVSTAESGREALDKAKDGRFHVVLLDTDLPDMDGREVCRAMRRWDRSCPIVVLTARDSESDTILALDAGAIDYVVKPFKFPVLMARLRAHLRLHESSVDAVLKFGPYTYRPSIRGLLGPGGRRIGLTAKEADIIRILWHARGEVVTREELIGEVWGQNSDTASHSLETHVFRLRRKIEPDPSNPSLLLRAPGGYALAE